MHFYKNALHQSTTKPYDLEMAIAIVYGGFMTIPVLTPRVCVCVCVCVIIEKNVNRLVDHSYLTNR